MPTYRIGLKQDIGVSVTVRTNLDADQLAQEWFLAGYAMVIVEYKGEEPGHTEQAQRIIPWHMVAFIDPVPYPIVTPDVTKEELIYGQDSEAHR